MPETAAQVSAIIACYKDAQAIPIMHQRLTAVFTKLGIPYQIIFVNDGSPDNSQDVLAAIAAADPHTIVIRHARNFGSQSAFTSGMRIATGDAVVLLDGDLQDPPELIEDFVREWRKGFDVVYGIRVQRETTAFLRASYKLFYRLFRKLSYVSVPVDAGDFSLISRRVLDELNALPETNRFLRGLRAWVGFRQTGVPYVRPERMFGRTTNSLIKNIGWARRAIVSFSYVPIDLIAVFSFLVVLFAFGLAVWQILFRLINPAGTPSGVSSIIVLMLFLGGVQLLCLAIIGSYLAQIYEEVKRRPPYIVESILNDPRGEQRSQTASDDRNG